jgi:Zn finger protein HypA/HybF involved in hydrogenase expression
MAKKQKSTYKGVPKKKEKSTDKGQPKKKEKKIEFRISKKAEAYLAFAADAFSIFMEAGLTPLEPYVNSDQKWKSKCQNCGQIVSPRVADVKGGRGGCKPCGTGKTRLSQDVAFAFARKSNVEPLEPYINGTAPWKCKCLKCGEIITPTLRNLRAGHGCINCQDRAFNFKEVGYFYVMVHKEWNSLKVGIGNTNNVTDRIKKHIFDGWELHKRYDFEKGKDAYKLEKEILKWIRKDLKLPVHLSKEFMVSGHTETVDLNEIDLPMLFRKVEELKNGLQE